ncbi:MAG: IPT/TIG domain-containing protein [Verrucomicrobiae bacterium]|nr:IPT/TIG domain-containing protein [Verrucomicrobiae bacterium]
MIAALLSSLAAQQGGHTYVPSEKILYQVGGTFPVVWEEGVFVGETPGGSQPIIRQEPNEFFPDGFQTAYLWEKIKPWEPVRPFNDAFGKAADMAPWKEGSIRGVTNVNATTEDSEPPGEASKFSVWYVWYAQFDGTLAVTLGDHHTVVTIDAYSGTSYQDLSPSGSRNAAANSELNLTLAVKAQHSYYFRLGEASGSVTDAVLSWNFIGGPVFPANDFIANCSIFVSSEDTISQAIDGATAEEDEPAHAGVVASHSLWYCFRIADETAPGLALHCDTTGSDFPVILAGYRSDGPSEDGFDALTPVAARDDDTGSLSFAVDPGATYFLAADCRTASGSLLLHYRLAYVDPADPPVVSGVFPYEATACGKVTVLGLGFEDVAEVRVGSDAQSWPAAFVVKSSTEIEVTLPPKTSTSPTVFIVASRGMAKSSPAVVRLSRNSSALPLPQLGIVPSQDRTGIVLQFSQGGMAFVSGCGYFEIQETDDLIHWSTRAVESSSIKTQGDAAEVAVPAISGHCYRLARHHLER